jgi:hypothetical protein
MASVADPSEFPHETGLGAADLGQIAARLFQIAGALQQTALAGASLGAPAASAAPSAATLAQGHAAEERGRTSLVALARHAYGLRRQRAAIFGSGDLFGEPAWDILLDLYIAQAEGKPVSVSSACIGSASPPTTGLRWLAVLTEQGLIARTADQQDHRRIMVRLTARGMAAMEQFLTLAREPAVKP